MAGVNCEPVFHLEKTAELPTGTRARIGRNQREWEEKAVMGIDWMTRRGLAQAIPPVYAEWIARQALAYIRSPDAPR